jgi:hypothetical protein
MDANLWFRNWKSKSDQKLSNTQVTRLVALTRQWAHDHSPDKLSTWATDPSEFWGFEPFLTEREWIQQCLQISFENCDDIAEDSETVSARRRVLLIVLHDIIQTEKMRLQMSRQAQSAKFLTTAIKNIVEQAYPGRKNEQLRAKCTQLQRYGRKYSSLERKEWVLAPLQGASSNFERPKIGSIELEALIAFGEVIYDEKHQSELRKAFECILDTCPFKRVGNLKPRLPSKSTRRRHRKRISRTNNTQKPLMHQIALRRTKRQNTQSPVNRFLTSMQLEDSLDFCHPSPRSDPFTLLERPPGSGESSTPHRSDDTRIQQVTKELHFLPAEARNAAQIITSQASSQQQEENHTQKPWDNLVMSSLPIELYPPGDQDSVPVLLEDPGHNKILGGQHSLPNPSHFPAYNPLDDSTLALIPFQFPIYDPLDDSELPLVPPQYPVYEPPNDSELPLVPPQFPVYNPLDDSALASVPPQFPVYNPLDDSASALVPFQFPVYNPLDDAALTSEPSPYSVYDHFDALEVSFLPGFRSENSARISLLHQSQEYGLESPQN